MADETYHDASFGFGALELLTFVVQGLTHRFLGLFISRFLVFLVFFFVFGGVLRVVLAVVLFRRVAFTRVR